MRLYACVFDAFVAGRVNYYIAEMEYVNERKAQIILLHLYADIYLNVYQRKKRREEKRRKIIHTDGVVPHGICIIQNYGKLQ